MPESHDDLQRVSVTLEQCIDRAHGRMLQPATSLVKDTSPL